ncbi:uncharacterized protein Z520_06296 [Fonsecaea multimorphosa CBS 102226]|uniref:Uncharacterized protein n=1 Tax=Fonsecaea multimorphosa CBS 102226 TaxID=1442371 RepID=A0A0D2IMF6_9EURO|nr:uncharacterized protein Z520_06296 [Fonsecaea multimorphosa CBS 102226]KIX98216.1 hypothetical protein Z520_06296 [Fonsecaea multimorphosa CBS 102226]OAL22648.1 hypothetical protein AYO22_07206 [Fonsecaea multimorphosa]
MAAIHRNCCLFCKKKPWDDGELEMLDWYSVNLDGRLDTRICFFHNQKQIQCLREVRGQVAQECQRRRRRRTAAPGEPVEELKRRIFMDHYREMQGDEKRERSCVLM